MKKVLALICAIAILASMGLVASFAAAPKAFYANDGYKYSVALSTSADGPFNDMGGMDSISDKTTQFKTEDCGIYIKALVAFNGVQFPEITKVGFYVVDTYEYVWLNNDCIFTSD